MSVGRFVLGLAPILSLVHSTVAQSYTATYLPSNAPNQTENGQTGTNQCGTALNQNSDCQNAYINNITDWCIWSPPQPGANAAIGDTERIEVAWCIKSGYGTRLIPDGSITGAHFVVTPDFIQVTGVGNLTHLNIPAGDAGGELDPHGADGNGNPVGGLVFSNAFGQLEQIHEWTNFVSDTEFCFRACKPGPMAPTWCQHIYDTLGCAWNMPANYAPGVFEQCMADSGEPMGVYGSSTFFQGQPSTPSAHPIPSSSSCTTISSIGNGFFISGTSIGTSAPASATATGSGTAGKSGSGVSILSTYSGTAVSGSGTESPSTSSTAGAGTSSGGLSNSNTAATGTSTGNAGFSRGATVNNGDWFFFTAGTTLVGSLVGAILVL